MATSNPRINITLEASTSGVLAYFARKEHKSVSGLAKELIMEALERREDRALSAVAATRDLKKAPRVSHADVWK
ncbi:MAG TPA: hypothetical protein PLV25_02065 [Opitutales bacterium]|nr:hypothetical protein [Opitutales bacterium]